MENMTYTYTYTKHTNPNVQDSPTETIAVDDVSCKAYSFGLPDAFGAMALCWFAKGSGVMMERVVKDAAGKFSKYEVVDVTADAGCWQAIHTRHLIPA